MPVSGDVHPASSRRMLSARRIPAHVSFCSHCLQKSQLGFWAMILDTPCMGGIQIQAGVALMVGLRDQPWPIRPACWNPVHLGACRDMASPATQYTVTNPVCLLVFRSVGLPVSLSCQGSRRRPKRSALRALRGCACAPTPTSAADGRPGTGRAIVLPG